jgi:AmmeMemoRadiSam system protein A
VLREYKKGDELYKKLGEDFKPLEEALKKRGEMIRAEQRRLADSGAAELGRDKFTGEHALEVELPFLQVALGDFALVPIMISRLDPAGAAELARALKQTFPAGDTLFVASTDLSHDYPYDVAVAMDSEAMRYVTAIDPEGLYRSDLAFRRAGQDIQVGADGKPRPACSQMCGVGTVLTLLQLANQFGGAKASLLDRRNSGDILGDKRSRIVGYASAAIGLESARPKLQTPGGPGGAYLDAEEQRELLAIARKSLEAYLGKGQTPEFDPDHAKLRAPGAAFVTLKKHGRLRGCIGYMEPADPLWKMIRDRAIDAAVHDSRFPKASAAELSELTIEISVLTPRVAVSDPLREIQIGRDGVWLELGMHRGVFLPQVPVEQGWKTVEEYLDNLCRKAQVPERGCWRSPEARIQRFTALVFGED